MLLQRRVKTENIVSNAQQALSRREKMALLQAMASGMSAQCPHCSCLFRHGSALKLHLRLRHNWTSQGINRYRLSVQRAIRDCRMSRSKRNYKLKLTAKLTLKQHHRQMRHRPKRQLFTCSCCFKMFLTKQSCRQHKLAGAPCLGGGDRHHRLHCVHCERAFLNNSVLTQHSQRDHPCEFCNVMSSLGLNYICIEYNNACPPLLEKRVSFLNPSRASL